jgi:hypothetical protein
MWNYVVWWTHTNILNKPAVSFFRVDKVDIFLLTCPSTTNEAMGM